MKNYFKNYPNKEGFFKEYGGAYIPPVLEAEMKKIADAYQLSIVFGFFSQICAVC